MRSISALRRLVALGAIAVVGSSIAATATDLVLSDGRILKSARIVTIGDAKVSVVHAGGVENIDVELVPLDVLARAHMALQEDAAAKTEKTAEVKRKASEEIAEREKAKEEAIQLRLAAAAARERALASQPPATARGKSPPMSAEAQLLALKAKFPRKLTETVVYDSDKRRWQPVVATVRSVDRTKTGYVSRSTTSVNTQVGRPDSMTIEVPHPDIWSDYKGRIQTTTVQALPVTLAKLDDQIETDLTRLRGQSNLIHSQVTAAQARMTIDWINQTLRPYLSHLRNLAK